MSVKIRTPTTTLFSNRFTNFLLALQEKIDVQREFLDQSSIRRLRFLFFFINNEMEKFVKKNESRDILCSLSRV